MSFTAKDVAELREITGAGMMDCKKALVHTDGDREKAIEYLREIGVSIAAKKASRIASEGLIGGYTDDKTGVLAELNCETDFVANTDGFRALVAKAAKVVADCDPADVAAWMECKTDGVTLTDLINNETSKCGEKITARRFEKFSLSGNGVEEIYLHNGGKIGVMLEVETDKPATEEVRTMAHDIAMHIAAFSPSYIYETEVPEDYVAKEKAILLAQAKNDPKNASKPDAILEKMLSGRLQKSLKEICLIEQPFAKDSSITVGQLVANVSKSAGMNVRLVRFVRLVMGEGLEKKSDNLAEEVAKMSGK